MTEFLGRHIKINFICELMLKNLLDLNFKILKISFKKNYEEKLKIKNLFKKNKNF